MNNRKIPLIWLILPSVVFILLVAAFVVKLSKPAVNSTEVPESVSVETASPAPVPVGDTGLSSLMAQISGWQINDPRLAAPVFDRKISLPAE